MPLAGFGNRYKYCPYALVTMSRSNSKSPSTSESLPETSSRASVHPTSRRLGLADPLQSSQPYISPYAPVSSVSGSSQLVAAVPGPSTYLNVPSATFSRGSSVGSVRIEFLTYATLWLIDLQEDFAGTDFQGQSTMSSSKALTAAGKSLKSLIEATSFPR